MRVIVTRVQPQAAHWVKLLAGDFAALPLPLIVVSAATDRAAVRSVGQRWTDYAAAMFVSAHAVQYFFAENPTLALLYQGQEATHTRAWATGLATRSALLAQGLPPAVVDAPAASAGQFDSEALWLQVRAQIHPGVRVLIVRGDSLSADDAGSAGEAVPGVGVGRDWLAQQLQRLGAEVDFVVAYQRAAPRWTPAQVELALAAARDGSVWLFSSAEALTHLGSLLPGQDWSGARAVATHARIAQAARALGFGMVAQARPTLPDVVASIKSLA